MARIGDPKAKERLLSAAQEVFAKKGLDNTKVVDITERAGLSKGAFYLHFKTKDSVFTELVAAMMQALGLIALDTDHCMAARESGDLRTFLQGWQDRDTELFEFVWQHRDLMRLVLDGGGSANHIHLIDDFASRAQQVSAALLKSGVKAGFYRSDLDIPTAATFIAGGYDRFARQLVRENRKPNIRSRIGQLQRLALMGVADAKLVEALRVKSAERKGTKVKSLRVSKATTTRTNGKHVRTGQ
ncbi:MAG: AcrR family transcriptional regulator [Pseudomonadota bacterium]|jgi:AcrR family transcriptional regulator